MVPITYPYDHGDNLTDRHSYTYAPYQGEPFLEAWIQARESLLSDTIPINKAPPSVDISYPADDEVHTASLLEALFYQLTESNVSQTDKFQHWLNWIIQRFEVSKRLHVRYSLGGRRAKPQGTYRELSLYIRFTEILAVAYRKLNKLPALNALIKCLDTLYSVKENLTAEQKQRVARVATLERDFVFRLHDGFEVNSQKTIAMPFSQAVDRSPKSLNNVTLLVADTIRSRAYAQALLAYGLHVGNVLLLTSSTRKQWGQSDQLLNPPAAGSLGGAFIPDLRIPLEDTCQALTSCVEVLDTGSVNSQEVVESLQTHNPELVIFSGFGGEIVRENILSAAGPFLHMHAGWLPTFRGSTTVYYSFLTTGNAGVSAILLSPGIDTGEIVYRALYPLPTANMNIDYYYDGIIRSDVMIRVLTYCSTHDRLPEKEAQNKEEGETYYVVHPLIKTISILMVEKQELADV
ncbi:formyltransferase family protein [Halomonas faecis]|uniref:formyltransferase family protein n=1 Tax=Halomonas faecis TaxID=1562110 RepID=UPI0013D2F727|nr:formyltransferase family protein [Halomonas faecis]